MATKATNIEVSAELSQIENKLALIDRAAKELENNILWQEINRALDMSMDDIQKGNPGCKKTSEQLMYYAGVYDGLEATKSMLVTVKNALVEALENRGRELGMVITDERRPNERGRI